MNTRKSLDEHCSIHINGSNYRVRIKRLNDPVYYAYRGFENGSMVDYITDKDGLKLIPKTHQYLGIHRNIGPELVEAMKRGQDRFLSESEYL